MERVLENDLDLTLAPDSLDADMMEFNCAGGIVDIRTAVLHEHRRSDLMTRLSAASPKPGCPRRLAFMEEHTLSVGSQSGPR